MYYSVPTLGMIGLDGRIVLCNVQHGDHTLRRICQKYLRYKALTSDCSSRTRRTVRTGTRKGKAVDEVFLVDSHKDGNEIRAKNTARATVSPIQFAPAFA